MQLMPVSGVYVDRLFTAVLKCAYFVCLQFFVFSILFTVVLGSFRTLCPHCLTVLSCCISNLRGHVCYNFYSYICLKRVIITIIVVNNIIIIIITTV